MPRFVLDHNFPIAVVTGIDWPPDIRLTSLETYEPRLIRDHEDWQVLTEMARRGDVDGYITNDDSMLNLPTEMVALSLTGLILVVTRDTGDDPLKATDLLMTHLVEITVRERGNVQGQLYRLRAGDLGHQRRDLRLHLRELADRENAQADRMRSEERAKIESWPGLRGRRR